MCICLSEACEIMEYFPGNGLVSKPPDRKDKRWQGLFPAFSIRASPLQGAWKSGEKRRKQDIMLTNE